MTLNSEAEYLAAVAAARTAAAAYYDTDVQTMSDAQYDELIEQITATEEAHPEWTASDGLLTQVGGGTSSGGDVKHPTPMLSLDKVTEDKPGEGYEALAAFIASVGGPVVVEPKLDGMAIRAVYRGGRLAQVVTRGDGQSGEGVTAQARNISGLPEKIRAGIDMEVRGEVFMRAVEFEVANRNRVAAGKPPFANSRNAVAGSLRSDTRTYEVPMSFAAYDVLGDGVEDLATGPGERGERGTYSRRINAAHQQFISTAARLMAQAVDFQDLEPLDQVKALLAQRGQLGYPIDGAVVKADRDTDRARLGEGTRAPKWALAFKFAADTTTTVVEDIEVTVGRTGRLALRARVTPTLVDGSIVTCASLHNVSWLQEQDIRIGDTVIVKKAGDVIPRVESPVLALRRTEDVPFTMSEYVTHMLTIWKCSPTLIAAADNAIHQLDRANGPYPSMSAARRSVTFDWTVTDQYNQGRDSLGGVTIGDDGLVEQGMTGVELDWQLIEHLDAIIDNAERLDTHFKREADARTYVHRAPVRWTPPETDPAGNPWDKSTLLWRSTTPELSVVGKLVYAVSRDALDIDGLSEAILTALVESEIDHDMSPDDVLITRPLVRDVADLFELDFGDLTNLATTDGSGKQRRVGEKTLTKIRAEVRRAHESAPFARVLTAIGMRSTGRTICRRLAAHYGTIDAIWDAIDGKTDLQDVEGIGPEKAALIRSEFQTKRDLIGRLDHLGLNMGRDAEPDVDLDMPDADQPDVQAHLAENDRADKVVAAPPLAGLTVVVTGSMKGTALAAYGRNEMNELIETHGGKSSGSVSTKTSLLVSSEPESTKTVKARDLGVKIVDPEEFRRHDRTDRIVASNPPSANAPSCDSRRSPIVAVGPLRGRRARRSPNPTSPGRHSMTPFLAWLLFPPLLALAFCGPPGVLAALRLHRSRRMAKHFLSAQSLLAPPLNRASQARTTAVAKAPAEAAVPSAPAQPSEIASSELMVLAARYLRALDGGDLDTKVAVLQSVSAHELVTRLCLVGRQLTREHADATGRSTSALLDDLYERAVRRHHELVVLA